MSGRRSGLRATNHPPQEGAGCKQQGKGESYVDASGHEKRKQ
jgi:hypothetical protein